MTEEFICPAVLSIAGENFPCDWMNQMRPGSPNHDGWAHANRAAEAIWCGDEGPHQPNSPATHADTASEAVTGR